MATVFDQIQKGALTESQVLSQSADILNSKFNIDSVDAEIKGGQITYTVKDALELMITISHNYAALLLSEKVRLSQVASFLESNGFNESKVGTDGSVPETTAADMALFLEKLYTGKLANTENTDKMIELLNRQRLNNKIPKGLPAGVVVAHKTGEIGTFTHDAGIIFTPKGDYIEVVLTDSQQPSIAEDRIGALSRQVYDYFK